MPELPEVETVRRGLAPFMEGARFTSIGLGRPDLRYPFPDRFAARLEGAEITGLDRRGKYLLAETSRGEVLIMHLGMSGRFRVEADGDGARLGDFAQEIADNPKHDHVVMAVLGGAAPATITFNDPRRFGFMDLVRRDELEICRHFAGMGPEPLSNSFSEAALYDAFRGRKAPVKTVLLDQRVIAGIGNIYACEALFRAGIHPTRQAGRISKARVGALYQAIIAVLEEAIAAGGSSLRDFANVDSRLGYFQHRFSVYDRAGEACAKCYSLVRRVEQAGRSTFYCTQCQH